MLTLLARLNSCPLWRFNVSVAGNRFRPPTFDRLLALVLFRFGLMGREEFKLFDSLLQTGMTVLDIGANQGVFTLYCADRVGPAGKVIAFEPDPEMFSALETNVKASGKTSVELHNLAIGAQQGQLAFQASRFNRGDNRLLPASRPGVKGAITVPVVSIDQILKGRKVDAIKMDVQGWEAAVLRGMRDLLASADPPWILLEICPDALAKADSSFSDVLEILQWHGYSLWKPNARQSPLDVGKVSSLKGIFGFTNAFAVPPKGRPIG